MHDQQLVQLVAIRYVDYSPAQIELAVDELDRRGLPVLSSREYFDQNPTEITNSRFCLDCLSDTTGESPPSTLSVNFVFGTRLIGWAAPCPQCGSVVKYLWFWFGLPVMFYGKYRVIYTDRGLLSKNYVGRRIR